MNVPEPFQTTEADRQSARLCLAQLSPLLTDKSSEFRILTTDGHEVQLPKTAVKILVDALRHLVAVDTRRQVL